MKLARFDVGDGPKLGLVDGQAIALLTSRVGGLPSETTELIARWDEFAAPVGAVRGKTDYALADVRLLAPIRRPGKILAIGLN